MTTRSPFLNSINCTELRGQGAGSKGPALLTVIYLRECGALENYRAVHLHFYCLRLKPSQIRLYHANGFDIEIPQQRAVS
ncbi:hypothetical protein SAMN05421753_112192 [Planctomicrobium piriforme]|uniref:Uncharacterized protein n=1 Tax=Planctomicrobium piriforme TaxID=1576369 RepID=A0A1I3LA42_9PLAN|nr:hypothetical protein SAMN05421753_112192 [Planctomicrobium piriforme]